MTTAATFPIKTASKAPYLIACILTDRDGRFLGAHTKGYGYGGTAMQTRIRRLNQNAPRRPGQTDFYRYAAVPIKDGKAEVPVPARRS